MRFWARRGVRNGPSEARTPLSKISARSAAHGGADPHRLGSEQGCIPLLTYKRYSYDL